MNLWLVLLLGGLITFGMRFSFVWLLGRYEVPVTMRRALRYVPPAVLSAIVIPELLMRENSLDFSLGNARLLAGVVAIAVAAWTKNSLLTILAGFVTLLVLQALVATR
ncbi:MAG: AzlD domain-containing protein [Chloroflexota bacterium]